jgi:hypothetical protein
MKATTIALSREDDRLLSRAAREPKFSPSEFIRQHLAIVEQYRRHPKPRNAGIVRALTEPATSGSSSVPVGSTAALICDTGALLEYLVENAPDHRLFRNAIDEARTRYISALALAEVDYFPRAPGDANLNTGHRSPAASAAIVSQL